MVKTALISLLVLGSISVADAMPVSSVSAGTTLPVVKTVVIIKKVVRRPAVRRVVVKKTIIRR